MPKPFYLYCLNFPNGKKYVGITINPTGRLNRHRFVAAHGIKSVVCAAIRKYGLPQMQILCIGNEDYILALEIKAIAHFQTRNRALGYNVSLGGTHSPMPDEVRAKIAASQRGKAVSMETRAKLSAARKGRLHSSEWSAKIGAAHKGKLVSSETRARMTASHLARHKTRPVSAETRAKLSAAWNRRRIRTDSGSGPMASSLGIMRPRAARGA
jgi:hypothetical protein